MYIKLLNPVFIALIVLLTGCGSGDGNAHKTGSEKSIDVSPDQLSTKLDPVCQMSMDQHPITDTMSYQGKLYGFCSSGCKEAFAAEPEKFLSELPH